ncbi:Protein of unknown function [Pseudomonas sp. NFPP33]|nr:DUF3717 domain-containing protein [Pseudomonas sp. NFPP33]AGH89230.1 hypothetical protein [uncultured bacterium]SDA85231.1 Protein of unknown function [Pseudomonas sp. NFPP33]
MADMITRDEVAAALERCCNANPSSGAGHRLHPDASLMADLFGVMLHYRQTAADLDTVAVEIRAALARWCANGSSVEQ